MADASPTVRQRELGLRLRKIRTGRGLTVENVAEKLMCSAAKVSRMETGARRPILRDIRELCELYSLDDVTAAEMMRLTKEAREQGWWARYEDLALYPYIGFEQDATAITTYSLYWLPALLQTEDYARAIIQAIAPRIEPEVLEDRVLARMRRQERLLAEEPPRYRALIDEAVFRREVGGSALMAAQIDKVLQLAESPNVTVQFIPFGSGAYSIADIMFTILEFGQPLMSPLVFVEGLISHQYYERADDVARFRESLENIRDSALTPRESMRYLADIKKEYDSLPH
ncbi:MAG TPA: helix-turn-helix transcriptional regulator [Trebonia sp.]|jgi:transcriptional regulator with XRE-family HTH domain|nr:helix-turn-helix transcriptional regulator [Trebonia sp.]